jgi:Periplasmic copper-binding protein (NosD)
MKRSITLGILVSLTLSATGADARTWTIRADGSGDLPTIQAGIDSAMTGDSLAVYAGVYMENLTISGKSLVLRGVDGADVTVIDGGGQFRVLTWYGGGLLEGFTIRNGLNYGSGGGIYLGGSGPAVIQKNVIENNTSQIGGGVFLDVQAHFDIIIKDNVIRGNWTQTSGGGMLIANSGELVVNICGNYIDGNAASKGGGIWCDNALVSDNIIIRNTADITGGGAECDRGVFTRNTVAFNNTINLTLHGAGITAHSAVVTNNIVVGNHGSSITPVGAGIHCFTDQARCNLVWDNDIDLDWCATDPSNRSEDPQFCDTDPRSSGNFFIQSDSPCAPEQSACGLIGARPVGCGTTDVELKGWGEVKQLYR